ncbi:MAG: sulfur carrier protein ThiS [Thermodesulfobacteriota bacterium]
MEIFLNGEKQTVPDNITLADLLRLKKKDFEKVVAELNSEIIETKDYEKTVLNSDDSLEILNFVGGG